MLFSEKLKALREGKKLTQRQLAKNLGVGNSTIAYYEKGDRFPSIDILIKIADKFRVSVDYLLGRESSEKIDVSSLTQEQIGILRLTIDEFIKANNNKNN